jgi:predicted nucleic acid-binding protein
VLSTQVLQEFFVTVPNTIPRPLHQDQAKEIIASLLRWRVIINDGQAIPSAIDLQRQYPYSFWDCLVMQAALQGRASMLLSENFQSGQVIESVRIVNPFE